MERFGICQGFAFPKSRKLAAKVSQSLVGRVQWLSLKCIISLPVAWQKALMLVPRSQADLGSNPDLAKLT
jgi:hypothetical protein